MPKTAQKTLSFPLAGVSRSKGYREQTRPYSTPWAVNVRGVGPLERRSRGGSRPGLLRVVNHDFGSKISAISSVTSVDSGGVLRKDLVVVSDGAFSFLRGSSVTAPTSDLVTDGGVVITTDDGTAIAFDSTVNTAGQVGAGMFNVVERNGRLLLADSVLKEFDPATGVVTAVTATKGIIPTGCPLVCLYRDRLFLSGADHVWYCSRQGDITDWGSGDAGDVGRAFAGQVERAGRIGSVITAMIPASESMLLIATSNTMWALRGDPATGTVSMVSDTIGVISPTAWAEAPGGLIAFLSNDGLYLMGGGEGSYPRQFSDDRVPELLRNIDSGTNSIVMCYDAISRGFHLFITPAAIVDHESFGQHWFIDIENKAMWPVVFQEGHQPLCATRLQGSTGLSEVVLGCRDGYLRKFSAAALTDDGEAIESHILLGPFRLTSDDINDAILTEIHGMMADNSGSVTWRVVMADSAEAAVDTAVAGITSVLNNAEPVGVRASGSWSDNRNKVSRPRARGPWAIVWLSSSNQWAYEAVAVAINQLGRLR